MSNTTHEHVVNTLNITGGPKFAFSFYFTTPMLNHGHFVIHFLFTNQRHACCQPPRADFLQFLWCNNNMLSVSTDKVATDTSLNHSFDIDLLIMTQWLFMSTTDELQQQFQSLTFAVHVLPNDRCFFICFCIGPLKKGRQPPLANSLCIFTRDHEHSSSSKVFWMQLLEPWTLPKPYTSPHACSKFDLDDRHVRRNISSQWQLCDATPVTGLQPPYCTL